MIDFTVMKWLSVILLATAIITRVSSDTPTIWQPPDMNRIPDRSIADPDMFPYIAIIWMKNLSPQWNGFILDENRIFTLADPVLETAVLMNLSWIDVRVGGSSWQDSQDGIYSVESVQFHPELQDEESILTIALIRVSRPISWSQVVKPIAVAAVPENRCEQCTMITRGNTNPAETEIYLKWASVLIFDRQTCNTQYREELEPNELCFYTLHERVAVTEFDLGLPIICNGTVVGMLNIEDDDEPDAMDPFRMIIVSEYVGWFYSNELETYDYVSIV